MQNSRHLLGPGGNSRELQSEVGGQMRSCCVADCVHAVRCHKRSSIKAGSLLESRAEGAVGERLAVGNSETKAAGLSC